MVEEQDRRRLDPDGRRALLAISPAMLDRL